MLLWCLVLLTTVLLANFLTCQVVELTGWRDHVVDSFESQAAENALSWLKENGHPEAEPFCQRFVSYGAIMAELDGAAYASDCGAITEAKTCIDYQNTNKFTMKIDTLRLLKLLLFSVCLLC